jgi:hypothetical protein
MMQKNGQGSRPEDNWFWLATIQGEEFMGRRLPSLVLGVALLAPVAAQADWGIRASYLVPMYVNTGQPKPSDQSLGTTYHYDATSVWLSNLDLILSWYPISFISLDLEGQFNLSPTNIDYPNTGIYVGPGVTLDLPFFLYARLSLPVQVTPSSAIWYLRAAGGFKLQFFVVNLYLEALFDFPLAGGATSAFGSQAISLAAGVWVKF